MGMYTELYLAVELSKDTPKDIVAWIDGYKELENAPCRIKDGFTGRDSYYFDSQPFTVFKYDDISNSYYLTTVFNLKNYENEIEFMLNTLEPYIVSNGHIGHTRYEEYENPTILFFKNGKIVCKEVKETNEANNTSPIG
jgi:hypothetical protein